MNEALPKISGVSKKMKFFFWTILFVIIGISGFTYWRLTPPKDVVEADAGFKKAKNTFDLEKLRAWAFEEIAKAQPTDKEWYGKAISKSEVPNYIQNLYSTSPDVVAQKDRDSHESYVQFMWGDPFFHWVIEVGSTNFLYSPNKDYPRSFLLAPGIYYTRQAGWELQ